jgi:hypothetical protein
MTKLGTYTLSTDDKEQHEMWLRGATIGADLNDFKNWMRDIVKHGGPHVNAQPLYDYRTMERTYEVLLKYLGEDING